MKILYNKDKSGSFLRMSDINTGCHLLVFKTVWCGPCKFLAPIIEEVKEEVKRKSLPLTIHSIDCDQDREIAGQFQINSVPTIILTVNGNRKKYTGERNLNGIISWLESNIK